MILGLTLAAQEPNSVQRVIDLKAIGYPQPPCDYMFQVDSYPKNHLEFLNSERLLVSFPADTSNCDKKDGYSGRNASKYRSVVMDLSGGYFMPSIGISGTMYRPDQTAIFSWSQEQRSAF